MEPTGIRRTRLSSAAHPVAPASGSAEARKAGSPVAALPNAPAHVTPQTIHASCSGCMQAGREGFEAYRANPALAGAGAALEVGVPAKEISERLAPKLGGLVATYKDIHQNPELSRTESRTAGIVAKRLRELGFEVTENFGQYEDPKIPCHGVVAVMKNGPGPTLLIREDMDALPIVEETGLPYASKVKVRRPDGSEVGVMHACGHDAHTTMLLGTAAMMAELKDRWSGTLIMIGQPAEEVLSGARAMLRAGLYEKFGKPDFGLGMHVSPEMPAGAIATRPGFIQANIDTLKVTMRGKGSHGARPWAGIDPIVMSSAFVTEAQTLVSREIETGKEAVATVGSIHGGNAPNVIPDEVVMQMSLRSYEPDVRAKLLSGVSRIANGVAIGRGVPADRMPIIEHIKHESIDATYNNPQLAEQLLDLWKRELDDVRVSPRNMGGEDFSLYTGPNREIPTVFTRVGAWDPKDLEERKRKGLPPPSNHQSDMAPLPEPTIRGGVLALVSAATSLLKKRAQ